MKSPPEQVPDPIARDDTEEFIRKHALKRAAKESGKSKAAAK
jgi:hypothetical protein